MLADLTFGQYYETDSFVHRLDPRIKILILIAYVVFIFVAKNFYAFLALAVFLAIAVVFSKIPFSTKCATDRFRDLYLYLCLQFTTLSYHSKYSVVNSF